MKSKQFRAGSAGSTGSASRRRAGGFSLLGLIIVMTFCGLAALLFMKVLPTYTEFHAARNAIIKVAPTASSPAEIIRDFDKVAQIDNIEAIAGRDLKIERVGDRFVASFSYERRVPLFANASLMLEYSATSPRR